LLKLIIIKQFQQAAKIIFLVQRIIACEKSLHLYLEVSKQQCNISHQVRGIFYSEYPCEYMESLKLGMVIWRSVRWQMRWWVLF